MADFTWFFIIGAIVVAGFIIYKFAGKKGSSFKDFKSVEFADIVTNELKGKLDLYGQKAKKGHIVIGFTVIGKIDKFYSMIGKMPVYTYFEETGFAEAKTDKNGKQINIDYDFTMFRIKNKFFLLRWLRLKKSYLIMRNKDDEGNILIRFDSKTSRFIFPRGVDFDSWGNVWTESEASKEYCNSIGYLKMLQQSQTHMINIPDRAVHLEIEHAKTLNKARTFMELEKGKYDKMKHDDTVIS